MLNNVFRFLLKTSFYSVMCVVSCLAGENEIDTAFKNLTNNSETFFNAGAMTDFHNVTKKYILDGSTLLPNRIESYVGEDEGKKKQVVAWAKGVQPIIHDNVLLLCKDFIECKKQYGTSKEKLLYQDMLVPEFVCRLFSKRPYVFCGKQDNYILRNGYSSSGKFEKIAAEDEDNVVCLNDYISYDEQAISALCGISSGSYCINNGARVFKKDVNPFESLVPHESQADVVGLVGPRFEKSDFEGDLNALKKPGFMEWKHMVVTQNQNSSDNGYGDNPDKRDPLLDKWTQLYEISSFPLYSDATADVAHKYEKFDRFEPLVNDKHKIVGYLDRMILEKRLKLSIEPFLYSENEKGKKLGTKRYVHVAGIGLGVWLALPVNARKEYESSSCEIQIECMMRVYQDCIDSMDLEYIAAIDFSWFPGDGFDIKYAPKSDKIDIICSKRNSFDLLPDKYKDCVLVVIYAWDSNSFAGNEYFMGVVIEGTSDSDTGKASMISELQNPEINPYMIPNILWYAKQKCAALKIEDSIDGAEVIKRQYPWETDFRKQMLAYWEHISGATVVSPDQDEKTTEEVSTPGNDAGLQGTKSTDKESGTPAPSMANDGKGTQPKKQNVTPAPDGGKSGVQKPEEKTQLVSRLIKSDASRLESQPPKALSPQKNTIFPYVLAVGGIVTASALLIWLYQHNFDMKAIGALFA